MNPTTDILNSIVDSSVFIVNSTRRRKVSWNAAQSEMEGTIVKLIILLSVAYFKFGLAQNICSDILNLDCKKTMEVNEKLAHCINNGSTLPNVNVEFPTAYEYELLLKYPKEKFNSSGSVSGTATVTGHSASRGAVCEWDYAMDEDDHRIPRSIRQAVCVDETTYSTGSGEHPLQCRQIFYPINVLKWTCKEGQLKFNFTQQMVSFGCGLEKVNR